ncbi:FAD-dependent pyridine nucleotide-disulfide oxidoreductase [Methanofollis liminatans DSM 4140]|uniref:FAD-dependent pyridine nucleotide-disulfide oxidoreductase n=1 Tax=Methanofollis liminatans DSM 4140 TaxID=28892 RepID=J1L5F2_9EURY|nr:NAD(P)/FAD-dependent oxidoreductase [Methanofollis liminatans]EJG08020.1 FAD-dependent pyridine nucleotide-disulfide oxidoreductase [Methanofollis liminatans DSM 4140]
MILVIGGGPAGRFAAVRLGNAGREVLLVEKGAIGGQCLNYGCMAVCALNDAARHMQRNREFAAAGILDGAPEIHFPALLGGMDRVQEKIRAVLDQETKNAGVEILYGSTARLDGRKVFIDGEEVEAEAVVIATGSVPAVPVVEGISLPGVYTAHTLPRMETLPGDLVIVGGGVQAAEFAYIFSMLGSRVTVLARSAFLKGLDPRLRRLALKELKDVDIKECAALNGVNGNERVESVSYGGNESETCRADAVLLAAGLVPNAAMIEGVEKGLKGEVRVNDRMETSVKGVYAAGDVTGGPFLTPVARLQGVVAAENILGIDRRFDPAAVPQSISLANELAFCTAGDDDGVEFSVPAPAGPGSFWSVPSGDTGIGKIRVDRESGEVRGVWAASPGAGIIATYMADAIRHRRTVHDLDGLLDVHPIPDGVHGLIGYAASWLRDHPKE